MYEQSIVIAGAGITVATLQNWMGRGLVELDSSEAEIDGRRRRRRYSERDIIRLALMAELVELGFTPSAAGDIVNRETLRPLGSVPAWMFHQQTDHFLIHGHVQHNAPLIAKNGPYVVQSPADLCEVIIGSGRKLTDTNKRIKNIIAVNLSELVRNVYSRILDACAVGHDGVEPDEIGSDAPDTSADE